MRDKARLTLETIARDPQGVPPTLALPLVSTLAFIAPNCPQNYIEDGERLLEFLSFVVITRDWWPLILYSYSYAINSDNVIGVTPSS